MAGLVAEPKRPLINLPRTKAGNKRVIFKGVQNSLVVTRYHSLIIDQKTLSEDFIITAKTKDNVIMGIMHKNFNLHGVQFHPESIKTSEGMKLIKNFIKFK